MGTVTNTISPSLLNGGGPERREEITHQRFAVAVELEHEAEINLYNQLRVRVRV
jgi:hypothetical protein